jgi:hypothetical protein
MGREWPSAQEAANFFFHFGVALKTLVRVIARMHFAVMQALKGLIPDLHPHHPQALVT